MKKKNMKTGFSISPFLKYLHSEILINFFIEIQKIIMIFCYWNIQGRGRPIRELMTYLEIPFQDIYPDDYDSWIQ